VPAKPGAERAAAPEAGGAKAAPRADADALQGAWKVVRRVRNGEEVGEKKAGPVRLYFRGAKVYEMVGEFFVEEYGFTLDGEQNPAPSDLTSARTGTTEAIYRVKGDTLTLCRPMNPDVERPATFASKADSDLELLVLKRDAKAPKLDLKKINMEQ